MPFSLSPLLLWWIVGPAAGGADRGVFRAGVVRRPGAWGLPGEARACEAPPGERADVVIPVALAGGHGRVVVLVVDVDPDVDLGAVPVPVPAPMVNVVPEVVVTVPA